MMKRILFPALSIAAIGAHAQKLPSSSPLGKVEQVVGLTTVTVEYSRPSARGRTVFGDLVPYGEAWRTGANRCTKFTIDGPVRVENAELSAGSYCLFSVPGADSWTLIFNRNSELSTPGERKQEDDALLVAVEPEGIEFTETLTFGFDEVKDDKARMDLSWENTRVSVRVTADATEQALANIREAMAKPDADFGAYNRCARFCLDRDIMPKEALEWATKSVALDKRYWNTYTLALAQAKNGLYKEAIATAQQSTKLAEEAKAAGAVKQGQASIEEWTKALPSAPAKGKKK